ncbi:hypothetical protein ANCCEY_08515 [Ancylostoma ceylanicum]|uniref:Reverse transcriptase domain-containing protein n=1 Tax=Ancylostoma ceylanicum TaxID=53326 RepID=A0A0D6LXP4_9BILA|nr:hypothetical protein ANCCEY_08515 [Ancylostoma ceylanicum]
MADRIGAGMPGSTIRLTYMHLRDSAKKAEGSRTTKRRLSHETVELIRQRGAARAAGNFQLTSELARRCREAIKEDLKERRAAVLAEAAEAGRSIRNTRRDFANRKTKMTALRRPDGSTTSSRMVMEKVIYDFYSDLLDSHVHLPPYHLRKDGYVIPSVLSSKVRHAIKSVKNRTAPYPDRLRPEHLKILQTTLVNTLARLFTRYLSECKVPSQWKTSRTVLLYKKGDSQDIGNYRPICVLGAYAGRVRRLVWKDRSPTESNEDDVHEKRMSPECPILAQRNENLRMLQLRISRSGSQHDERPRSRAGQEEASGLESLQKHRGRSEEDEEYQAPCPPLQHHAVEEPLNKQMQRIQRSGIILAQRTNANNLP